MDMKSHDEIQKKLNHSLEVMMGDAETSESFRTLIETMGIYEKMGYSTEEFQKKNKEYLEYLKGRVGIN
jgi:hypothetical protein